MKSSYSFLKVTMLIAMMILLTREVTSAQGFSTVTPLSNLTVTAITGEKPQSKVWYYAGKWWMVMPNSSGTQIWRLDGTTWTSVLNIDPSQSAFADCKAVGNVTHILLYKGTSSSLVSVEYVPASATYQLWTTRTSTVPITLDAGVETATIDIDGNGRMWLANAGTTEVYVRWSDSPYSSWSSPISIATGINDDDICAVASFAGKIGVMWSNQNAQRFGFKYHVDGADVGTWSADEVPASQSASIGAGMADDHINLKVASDGTIYSAVKTSFNDYSSGKPQIALLIRRPSGTWDDLYEVSTSGTRAIVVLNESDGKVKIIFTSSDAGGNILYKESSTSSISFGSENTLISGTYNNATSTKQNYSEEVVVLASTGSSLGSVLATDAVPDLVAHWKMDETSGSTIDDDALNNNGTLTGSPTFVPGVTGNALNLDGAAQYSTVADDNSLDITSAITMAAWIKCDQTANTTQRILTKAIMGATDGYELSLSSAGKVFTRFNEKTSGETFRLNSNTNYPLNGSAWMHVAATYDGTYIKIYINGLLDNTGVNQAFTILTNDIPIEIGRQNNLSNYYYYKGKLDDVRIYNRALSAAEILAIVTIPPPVLYSPANATASVSINPALTWNASTGASSYRVQVSTVSDFSTTVYDQSGITTTSASVTGLANNTQYYWRVNAYNASGTSDWSATWNFTTIGLVTPNAPVLTGPTNSAYSVAVLPTLSWSASTGATTYRVQVSALSDFSTIVFDQAGITATSAVVTPSLVNNTHYYWRVNATNVTLTSGWSQVWSFTTISSTATVEDNGAGYALDFDGSNGSTTSDYVTCGNGTSLNITQSLTIEAWVKPTATKTHSIVKKYAITNSGYELFLESATNGRLSFRLNGSTTYRVNSTSFYNQPISTWIHVAGTYDYTTKAMKIFVNGKEEGSVAGPTSIVSLNSPLVIGAELTDFSKSFQGNIDEVRVWNIARSEADIKANMTRKLSGSENGLVGYWRFDETSGILMNDVTSNNNDGTMTNMDPVDHVWSGAALGDASAYDYDAAGGYTASLNHTNGDAITAATTSGTITGIQVYRADDTSIRTGSTGISGYILDPSRFWGVKAIGTATPTYTLVYNYNGNPAVTNEAGIKLLKRNDISVAAWVDAGATLDVGANTLTVTGATGTEYALAIPALPPPAAPVLLSPADLATGIALAPTLNWNSSLTATSYQLQVSTVSNFTSTISDQTGLTSTTYSLTGLLNNTVYYWRVNATNSTGTGIWSSIWSFTTTQSATLILQDGLNGYSGTRDTYTDNTSGQTATVRGGETVIIQDINPSQDERRSLLSFDLSSIPSGSVIESAELQFNVTSEGQGFRMYRMLTTWNESTLTYASLGNRHFAANGTDAETIVDASWPGVDGVLGSITVTVPVSTIQDWVDGTLSNNGWLMIASHTDDGQQLSSRENTTQTNRPKLTVHYIPSVAPTITVTNIPLTAFTSIIGTPSAQQSYTVSGINLSANIIITAPSDFEVSTSSGSGFGSSVTLTQSGGSVPSTPIFVRFNRLTSGASNGNITHVSSGATTRNVVVSGTATSQGTLSFQEGVNGYNGTKDTHLWLNEPSISHATLDNFKWDQESSGGIMYSLLRFDDIFGSGAGQIPSNAVIQSANLTYTVTDLGNSANVYEVLVDWTEDATYNDFGGDAGVQSDEFGTLPVTSAPGTATGSYVIDVTSSLAAWKSNPTANKGWLFNPSGTDGVIVSSSENATVANRPKLSVVYLLNPPNQPVLVSPLDDATGVATAPSLNVTVSDPESGNMTVSYYGRKKTTSGSNFTIVAFPDSQNQTASASGGTPDMFNDQTLWVKNNQASRNIVFATHEGDVTNTNTTGEWDIADPIMANLESSLPGLPNGIPYGISIGNHDGAPGSTANYNAHFSSSRFSGRSYYGGHYSADNDNNYELFSAGGMDFIIIHLEMDANLDPGTLTWANTILQTNSARRAIVTTHSLIQTGNPASFNSNGTAIYNALKGNPNLFLMLCGHVPGTGQRSDTYNGHTVYTLLADYQSETNGGNGYMRIMEFSPQNNLISVKTYSPHLNASLTSSDNEFTIPYIMGNDFALIGTINNVTSGTTANISWPDLDNGMEYEWYVTVNNGESTITGPTWSFTTAGTSWTGTTSTDWTVASNWSNGIPGAGTDVAISSEAVNQPVISAGTIADCRNLNVRPGASLKIESSGVSTNGSLIVHGTSTGNVTYNRVMPSDKYRYLSPPVGMTTLPAGTFWRWNEPIGVWGENVGEMPTTSASSGLGYTALASSNTISFTGSIVGSASQTATAPYNSIATRYMDERTAAGGVWGGGGWNLLGNPFTSALRVSDGDANPDNDFITVNTDSFDPSYQAVYIYNGSDYTYIAKGIPGYTGNGTFSGNDVQVGQGFFVLANYNNVIFNFTPGMQTHNTTVPMTKSASAADDPWPGLLLKVKHGTDERSTLVVYNEKMTAELDPGYDVGQLSTSPDVEIYTALAANNEGVNFARQALPIAECEKNIIPVGINSAKGGEITFSASVVPLGNYKFYLEDRITGTITNLNTNTYTVTIPENTLSTGRFFIHPSENIITSIKPENTNLLTLRIWASHNEVNIEGTVSSNATAEVYDLQGRKIIDARLANAVYNKVKMPAEVKGIYIVIVKDGAKVNRSKVVFL